MLVGVSERHVLGGLVGGVQVTSRVRLRRGLLVPLPVLLGVPVREWGVRREVEDAARGVAVVDFLLVVVVLTFQGSWRGILAGWISTRGGEAMSGGNWTR